MDVIVTNQLKKEFRFHHKATGAFGSIKSVFRRTTQNKTAIHGLDLRIQEGEFVGLIGLNGAGKSTTTKILSGIMTPTSGSAKVLGFTPWERKLEFRKQMSLVAGNKSQLIPDLPPMETFLLHKDMYNIPSRDFKERLDELTRLLDVKNLVHVQSRKLSLGERMKMELIASLLHTPRIIFLDEPTIGLDLFSQRAIRAFLKAYNESNKATILFTSHYLDEIQDLCTRLIVLDKGQVVYDGPTSDLIRRYSTYKYVTVTFKDPVDVDQLRLRHPDIPLEVTSLAPMKYRIRVPRGNTNEVSSLLLGEYPIDDLTIEELSIEDVIANVYRPVHDSPSSEEEVLAW